MYFLIFIYNNMKLLKYNKFKFLIENSQFSLFQQFGLEPQQNGPGYGFAIDPSISVFGQEDSIFNNQYLKTPMMVNTLLGIIKNINKGNAVDYSKIKYDYFLEDADDLKNLKILRLVNDNNLYLDVYISFELYDEEFFGVFKKFNYIEREKLISDLFTDSEFTYIDIDYILKIDNYFYKVLLNWFKPELSEYKTLSDEFKVKDDFGKNITLPLDAIIKIVLIDNDNNNEPFIRIKYKEDFYIIDKINYYYFNYYFEKNKKEKYEIL